MTCPRVLLYDTVREFFRGPDMTDAKPNQPSELPRSLEGHDIPAERLAAIRPLVADLAATALAVSRGLPFQADAADFVRVLEAEKD